VHQVNEVAYVPAQAVEFPDDECVTAPQRLAAAGKSRPVVAPAGSLVFIEVRVGDAGDEQRIALGSSAWEPSAFEARVYPISTCACSLNGRLRDAPAAATGVKPLAQPVTQSTSCKPRFRNDYGAPVPPGADSAEETRSGYTSARFALDVPMAAVYGTERSNMEILEVLPEFLVVI